MDANERKSVAKDHMIFSIHEYRSPSRIVSFLIRENPCNGDFHGDAHKSRFSNALIIMELRIRT